MCASKNTPVYIIYQTVKNYIYSNGDLDLWPNDPKINRVLPLPQGNHVAKFGKDSIYRTKVIERKLVWTTAHPPAISSFTYAHPSSPQVFSGVRVTRSLVLCACFVVRCLSFWPLCFLSFGLRILITPLYTPVSKRAVLCDWIWRADGRSSTQVSAQ
jgi:hypothetical protein